MYRSTMTGLPIIVGGGDRDVLGERTWTFDGHSGATATDEYGTVEAYERVEPAKPTAGQLGELAGTYASDEAETAFVARSSTARSC